MAHRHTRIKQKIEETRSSRQQEVDDALQKASRESTNKGLAALRKWLFGAYADQEAATLLSRCLRSWGWAATTKASYEYRVYFDFKEYIFFRAV